MPGLTVPYSWVPAAFGEVPPQAVDAGHDMGGERLYVCRAPHNGDTIPGKVVPSHRGAYVGRDWQELKKDHYEVLCATGQVSWVPDSYGGVPPNALVAGQTCKGEKLYVGRVRHRGTLTPGKVHTVSWQCCFIPFAGREVLAHNYEVLIVE